MAKEKNSISAILHQVDINTEVERSKCRSTGKVRFTSESHASFFIHWLKWKYNNWLKKKHRRKHRVLGKPTVRYVYYCRFCEGYHITKEHPHDYQVKKDNYHKKYFS